jgi:two-component system, OmpR family, heavy metal sensor histidine kinase CusS
LSLAGRLMLWYGLTAVALALTAAVIIYWGLSRELRQGADSLLLERVQVLRALLREGTTAAQHELRWEVESEWEWLEHHQIFLRILDPNQNVVVETRQLAPQLPAGVFPAAAGPEMPLRGRRIAGPFGGKFQVMSAEAAGPRGDGVFVIQAAFDLRTEGQVLDRFRLLLAIVVGGCALLSLVFGYQITRRGLRPVAEIVGTTRRIGGSTLSERIRLEHLPPELASLADSFNAMLERLDISFARLSRFSADVAHELRTPLNNLRGEAEVALSRPRTPEEYRNVLASSLEECGSLAKTIDRLLFIAQAERSEAPILREQIGVYAELRSLADYYEPALAEKGLELRVECEESLSLEADRELFRRAVGNLVANALAFTPRGGTISLCGERRDGTIRVQVRDTGIGIPAEHLPHVLDRFYRVESTRSKRAGGTGLGLSIVKAVMDIHGGRVDIASQPGAGTTATLIFPSLTKS